MYGVFDIVKDVVSGGVDMAPPELREKRIAFCNGCEHLGSVLRDCKICHCFVDAKVTFMKAQCPIQKW